MEIRAAKESDLDQCFVLDVQLTESRAAAAEEGFLISGDKRESYDIYLSLGAFYVAEEGGQILGFIFALPPDTAPFEAVRQNKDHFTVLDPEIWNRPNLGWVGKVAVLPARKRHGIGKALFNHLFAEHPTWNLLSSVVIDPIENAPAAALHEVLGFNPIGTLPLGNRGTMKKVVCGVYFRGAHGYI